MTRGRSTHLFSMLWTVSFLVILRISKCCKMTCCWFPLLSPSIWITLPQTCNLSLSIFNLVQWLENYSKQCHWRGSMHLSMNKTFRRLGVMLRRCLYNLGQNVYCLWTDIFSDVKSQIISYWISPLSNPAHSDIRNYTWLYCSSQYPSETSLLTLIE